MTAKYWIGARGQRTSSHSVKSTLQTSQGVFPGTPSYGLELLTEIPHPTIRIIGIKVLLFVLFKAEATLDPGLQPLVTEFGQVLETCPQLSASLELPRVLQSLTKELRCWGTYTSIWQQYFASWHQRGTMYTFRIKRSTLDTTSSTELIIMHFFGRNALDRMVWDVTLIMRLEGGQLRRDRSEQSIRLMYSPASDEFNYHLPAFCAAHNNDVDHLRQLHWAGEATVFDRGTELESTLSVGDVRCVQIHMNNAIRNQRTNAISRRRST